ncbi:MAG: IS110 family transposase [Gammaproteobacteria bacterium]
MPVGGDGDELEDLAAGDGGGRSAPEAGEDGGGGPLPGLGGVAEAKVRLKRPDETKVVFCYEAGRDGCHPYRRLTELGHEVWVIDSASIEVSRKMRRAKSDGIDADKLSELMQRQARGEKALRIVRVPPVEVEDQRLLPREREMLLEDLQRVRNRIASLLFTQGYREVPKRARGLRAWLETPREMGAQLRERLERDIERLTLLEGQFQVVEKAMLLKVRQDRKTAMAQVAWALMRLCGIGWVGAWVLASELYGWRTFRNRREVGGALGRTPTPYSSGEDEREQGISKATRGRGPCWWSWPGCGCATSPIGLKSPPGIHPSSG